MQLRQHSRLRQDAALEEVGHTLRSLLPGSRMYGLSNHSASLQGYLVTAAEMGRLGFVRALLECRKYARGFSAMRVTDVADAAAHANQLHIVQELRVHGIHCTKRGADGAARRGHLRCVQDLRENGIHCTHEGADAAASNGHLHIVLDLRVHGIQCTQTGANLAAANDHLRVVRDLRDHGIHCSQQGANAAVSNGHVDVVQDLRVHDIHCAPNSADVAASKGHLAIVQDLRAHGIHCTQKGADDAAMKGHVHVLQDLRAHGIHCSPEVVDDAAANGHVHIVQDLRAHGIHCTTSGANAAATNGHLGVVRDLRAHGIHCTQHGADGAAGKGHVAIVQDLRAHGIHCSRTGRIAGALSGKSKMLNDLRVHAHLSLHPQLLVKPEVMSTTADQLPRLIVVMDVDRTLLCPLEKRYCSDDQLLRLGFEWSENDAQYEVLRPNAREFLQEIATFADVVLFTTRPQKYADLARDLLDPGRSIVKKVFCRDHLQNLSLENEPKDLYFVAASLERVVLVDDEWCRFGCLQLTNCLPVKGWCLESATHQRGREELYTKMAQDCHLVQDILPVLKRLATVSDVRPVLSAHIVGQKHGLSNAFSEWSASDLSDIRKVSTVLESFWERAENLRKGGCKLPSEAITSVADSTLDYVFYCLRMIEESANHQGMVVTNSMVL